MFRKLVLRKFRSLTVRLAAVAALCAVGTAIMVNDTLAGGGYPTPANAEVTVKAWLNGGTLEGFPAGQVESTARPSFMAEEGVRQSDESYPRFRGTLVTLRPVTGAVLYGGGDQIAAYHLRPKGAGSPLASVRWNPRGCTPGPQLMVTRHRGGAVSLQLYNSTAYPLVAIIRNTIPGSTPTSVEMTLSPNGGSVSRYFPGSAAPNVVEFALNARASGSTIACAQGEVTPHVLPIN